MSVVLQQLQGQAGSGERGATYVQGDCTTSSSRSLAETETRTHSEMPAAGRAGLYSWCCCVSSACFCCQGIRTYWWP